MAACILLRKQGGQAAGTGSYEIAYATRIICFANKEDYMANVIDDATIDYVGILAKLELSDEEKEQAKKDMASMLDYIDKLNELDTTGVEPMSHVFPIENVMREDVVTNGDESEKTLFNAPERKDKTFVVPKTVE